jgi:hypothetical protein
MSSGYSGVLAGHVIIDYTGGQLKCAETYFMELGRKTDGGDEFMYNCILSDMIYNHCWKYYGTILPEGDTAYCYQAGFGGKYFDGLVDFYLPEKPPKLPPMKFTINDVKYTLVWTDCEGWGDSDFDEIA